MGSLQRLPFTRLPGNGLTLVVDIVMTAFTGIRIELFDDAADAGVDVNVAGTAGQIGFDDARVDGEHGWPRLRELRHKGVGQ